MLYDKRWDAEPNVELEPWRRMLFYAADALESYGWCQGNYRTENGHMCARGAVEFVEKEASIRLLGYRKLQEVIGTKDITGWNDVSGRTPEEVIVALRKAGSL